MITRKWMIRQRGVLSGVQPGKQRAVMGSLLLLLMIIVLIFSTSACSKRNPATQPDQPTQGAGDPTPASGQPPAGGSSNKPVVITFAAYTFLDEAYKPVIEEFQKQYPDITVQVREAPASVDVRAIASAADTSLLMFRPQSGSDAFVDLTSLQEVDPEAQPDRFWPGILDACKDGEGRAYGLPVTAELTGIFYREQAFEDAGLPLPQPGWTWEDFKKAVDFLSGTENNQRVYGFADDSFVDTPDETLLSSQISDLLSQSDGDIDVDRLEAELQWYLNSVESGSLYSASIYPQRSPFYAPDADKEAWSKVWNNTWADFHEMFLNHPPAMWKGRLDQIYWADVSLEALPDGSTTMGATSGPIIEGKEGIGWAPFPVSADGQSDRTTPSAVTCAVISAGAENSQAAWTWVKFLAAHPILPEWSLAVPAQPTAAEASGFWSKIPEKLREPVTFAMEHGWYSSPYPEELIAVNQALLRAAAGDVPLRVALVEASNQLATGIVPTPDSAPVVVAPPEPTSPPGETAIDFYSPLFIANERSKTLVKEFNELHPEISVQFATESDIQAVAGLADAFDCFAWLPESELPAEKLVDLNQFLVTEPADLLDDFNPEALDEFSQDGMLFGLPTAYRPNLIFYNADLLAERGINPPAMDWTYAEFMELLQAVTSGGEADRVYGFALEYPTADLDMFLAGQGVRLIDATGDAPEYRFNTVETREALEWLAEQVNAGVIFPVTPLPIGTHEENFEEVRELILAGRVAFWMSWFDEGHGGAYSLYDAPFKIGVATIPLPEDESWRPYQPALGQYISRNAENPDACWEWMKFLAERPDSDYGIPARRSVRESEAWAAQVGPEVAAIYQAALEQRRTRKAENVYGLGPVRDGWDAVLAEVVHGAGALPLLDDLQGRADAYSDCLAASADYQSGDAGQRAQAETACAGLISP